MRRTALLAFISILLWSGTAFGHARSVSYSDWTLGPEGGRVRLKVSLLDLSALEGNGLEGALQTGNPSAEVAAHLQSRVQLNAGGRTCEPHADTFFGLGQDDGFASYEWWVHCEGSADGLRSDLLFDLIPSHVHFARIAQADSNGGADYVLDTGHREAAVASEADGDAGGSILAFVPMGFKHILSGWDHLLFIFVLMLTARSFRSLAFVVTGFTLAHSLTLAIAALGYANPASGAVEAIIGLSIAIVAIENVWVSENRRDTALPVAAVACLLISAVCAQLFGAIAAQILFGVALFTGCYFALVRGAAQPERWRWAAASLFGLVHGFAFSGVLSEASLGTGRLVTALVGFNTGVELGQLTLIALLWPVLLLIRKRGQDIELAVVRWGSAVALCAGTFWFVSRGF